MVVILLQYGYKPRFAVSKAVWRQYTCSRNPMALLERVSTLIRANLNELIERGEPKALIRQIVPNIQKTYCRGHSSNNLRLQLLRQGDPTLTTLATWAKVSSSREQHLDGRWKCASLRSDEVAAGHTISFFCAEIMRKIWKLKEQRYKILTGSLIRTVFRRRDAKCCGCCTCVRKSSNN